MFTYEEAVAYIEMCIRDRAYRKKSERNVYLFSVSGNRDFGGRVVCCFAENCRKKESWGWGTDFIRTLRAAALFVVTVHTAAPHLLPGCVRT